jgi:signal transduction histidine kinase
VQVEEKGLPLARAAAAAADEDNEKRLRTMIQNHPPNPPAGMIRQALETVQPAVAWLVTGDFLARLTDVPMLVQMIKALKSRSYMAIPMIARGRTIGLIHFGMAESGRYYDPFDLVIAQDLASRAGLAIDNSGLYQEAQAAVVARDQFLAVASHEVRTPLTIVQGYAQLIRRQAERAGREGQDRIELDRNRLIRSVDNIEAAAERLRALIADLLEVSTMRDRTMTLARERVDLRQLIEQSLAEVRRDKVHHEHLQELEIVTDLPDQPVWGEWDGDRLIQVLTNLIANAVKYSFSGGVIEIGLEMEPEADHTEIAHLRVSDQGIGIPSSEIQGLFEPFRRTSTATARHYPGLGLGLAVSREVISRHAGRIWVESEGVDQGSTFHVVLPIMRSDA